MRPCKSLSLLMKKVLRACGCKDQKRAHQKKAAKSTMRDQCDFDLWTQSMASNEECWWCGKTSSMTCNNCNSAKFCSQKHLDIHCQRTTCSPFKIVTTPEKGRCVIATRDIQPMELIISDTPVVVGPSRQRLLVCVECLQVVDGSVRCADCGLPLCSQDCAKTSSRQWHLGYECSYLRSIGFRASQADLSDAEEIPQLLSQMASIIPLRLIIRGVKGIECSRDFTTKPLYDFCSAQTLATTPKNAAFESSMTQTLWNEMKVGNLINDKTIVSTVISQLFNNAKSLEKAGNDSSGLYAQYALINHACVSNAKVVIGKDNFNLEVRAQVPIKCGEEITTRYIGVNTGAPVRADIIQQHWSFTCGCLRCSDPTDLGTYSSALICGACRMFNDNTPTQGLVLPHSPDTKTPAAFSHIWKCNSCEKTLTKEAVHKLIDSGLRCIKNNTTIPPDADLLEQVIKDLKTIYHPKHYLIIQVKFVLMRVLSKETGRSKRAILPEENVIAKERRLITLCNEILEVLNVLDPGLSPNRGRVLKELISPFMSVSNYELKSETIDEKEFKMRKTFCSKLAKDLVECYKFEFI